MRLAFLLQRSTDLKSMGPLAAKALEKGHEALLFYFEEVEAKNKEYLKVRQKHFAPLVEAGASAHALNLQEVATIKNFAVDALIIQEAFHSLNSNLDALENLRKSGIKLISIAHFFEMSKTPLDALKLFDKSIYLSKFARDLHLSLAGKSKKLDYEKNVGQYSAVAGSPMFDQFRNMNKEQVRKKLGIESGKKVVLLIAPVISFNTPWRFHVWRDASKYKRATDAIKRGRFNYLWEILTGTTFRDLFHEIKQFCERNNAILIVKSRGKQQDLLYITDAADMYFDGQDDQYFPQFSSYQLMSAADLCITVNSMAAIESVIAGSPCINIYVPHHDRATPSTKMIESYDEVLMGGSKHSLMNATGLIKKIDRRKAPGAFRNNEWEQLVFKTKDYGDYAEKYMGFQEISSSEHVIRIVEGLAH